MLPKASSAIQNAGAFESNQMHCLVVRLICDSTPCLADMTEKQINDFDDDIIDRFIFKSWLE
jgi:hypothetical protein